MTFNDFFSRFMTFFAYQFFLLLRNSSLQKPPFITAHFVNHCTLKQALRLSQSLSNLKALKDPFAEQDDTEVNTSPTTC